MTWERKRSHRGTADRATSSRGVARTAALVVAPLALCAGIIALGRAPAIAPAVAPIIAAAPAMDGPSATSKATAALLTRLGLDPEALAAAGVTAQQVPALIAAVRQAVEAGQEGIPALDSQHGAARAQRDRLEREIVAGTADADSVAAFPVAASQALEAEMALESALAALHVEACAGLPADVQSALLAIRANRRTWPSLPTAHLVAERSEPEWLALRDALAAARIAEASDEQPDDAATATIAAAEGDVGVQAAILGVAVNGTAVELAWTQETQ